LDREMTHRLIAICRASLRYARGFETKTACFTKSNHPAVKGSRTIFVPGSHDLRSPTRVVAAGRHDAPHRRTQRRAGVTNCNTDLILAMAHYRNEADRKPRAWFAVGWLRNEAAATAAQP